MSQSSQGTLFIYHANYIQSKIYGSANTFVATCMLRKLLEYMSPNY
jgi:hypothetical protein